MKFMEKTKRFFTLNAANHDGFTLVELIVVIAILAILAGVALPAYSGYVEKSKRAGDEVLLKAVNEAFASACLMNGVSNFYCEDVTKNITLANGLIPAEYVFINENVDASFDGFYENTEAFEVFDKLTYIDSLGMFVDPDTAEGFIIEALKVALTNSSFNNVELTELTGDVSELVNVLATYLGTEGLDSLENSGFKTYLTDVLGMKVEDLDPTKAANAAVLYLANNAANMDPNSTANAKDTLLTALWTFADKDDGNANFDIGVINSLSESTGSSLASYAMLYATAEAIALAELEKGNDAAYKKLNDNPPQNPIEVLGVVSEVFKAAGDDAIYEYIVPDQNGKTSMNDDIDAYLKTMETLNTKENELKTDIGSDNLYSDSDTIKDLLNQLAK